MEIDNKIKHKLGIIISIVLNINNKDDDTLINEWKIS